MSVTALVDIIQADFQHYLTLGPLKEKNRYGMTFQLVMEWKYSHGMTLFSVMA